MIVMKFGGTSVGSPEMILRTAELMKSTEEQKVAVVSAMSGITDLLIESAKLAGEGDKNYKESLSVIAEKEKSAMKKLFGKEMPEVSSLLKELSDILNGIFLVGELTERALDTVKSFGERISARVVSEVLRKLGTKAVAVDANKFLVTNEEFGNAFPLFEESEMRAKKLFGRLSKEGVTPVVTGFIGATKDGKITTLGRGGSDFSATIIGRILDAREVWIWTDVNGVMSADPRIVNDARSLKYISYNEASELSYFGAKVIHPKAILPVYDKKIPVRILNTFEPEFEGTLITEKEHGKGYVKAITVIKDISLLTVFGKGMLGVPGIAERVFRCAAETKSNVLMISQSSSEQNICFAVQKKDSEALAKRLKSEFEKEIKEGAVEGIVSDSNIAIVSAVGAGIKSAPNVSGKIFSSLGRNGINVIAIAQGSSDYNVSFAVKKRWAKDAIKILHKELGLASKAHRAVKTVNIVQFGTGTVGSALFDLIRKNSARIKENAGIEIRYLGIVRSKEFLFGEDIFDYVSKNGFNLKKGKVSENQILKLPANTVLVDVTNTDALIHLFEKAIEKGINVATSNKKNITDFEDFKKFTAGPGIFKFETTVGAALPVIKTLAGILETGDKIKKITALPSGSLSFIFGKMKEGVPLLSAINEAKENGYTEPNPMDDLKGTDIYRKGKILLNVLGRNEEIAFKEFAFAKTLEEFSKEEFRIFEKTVAQLSKNGVVFPVLEITENGAEVKLKPFDGKSAFASLLPGENIFEIFTEHYGDVPIVIKGKGAGAEITASGVLSDILEIGREL